jgi:hypothetical protein
MADRCDIPITFVLSNRRRDWNDLETLQENAIAASPERFVGGRNSWIAQGYLRLRDHLSARGYRVVVSDRPVAGTICIAHRDDLNEFNGRGDKSFLVCVRADRPPAVACDLAIRQNGIELRSNERFLPLWPQPGLQPRDPQRPRRIRNIAYLGRSGTEPRWFRDLRSSPELAARGVRFESRGSRWHDYREVDLVIAARTDSAAMLAVKPATKIYNAWLAGVPILAAPEPAYLEVWRSRLDFLVVQGSHDVIAAVDQLNASPTLFDAMVSNGRQRGSSFAVDTTRQRWLVLLEEEVLPAYERVRPSLPHRRGWFLRAMARQKALSRSWKCRLALERWKVRSSWSPAGPLEGIGKRIALASAPLAEHAAFLDAHSAIQR